LTKLSITDFANATQAIKAFKRNLRSTGFENRFEVNIGVEDLKGNQLLEFYDVEIIFGYNTNYDTVDIMWEPFLGKKFNQNHLYGRYSTTYNKMEHSYKELTIYSDKRKIILQG
jgi:hypothetical protein